MLQQQSLIPAQPPMQGSWRWLLLLLFALVAPVTLPAGGIERRQPELRRRTSLDPWFSHGSLDLKASPNQSAPVLAHVPCGEPLRILRGWTTAAGKNWLYVQRRSEAMSPKPSKGWVNLDA